MKQHEFTPSEGSHRRRRRVGRGDGSGRGTYSGRGMKGQKARSGGKTRRGFAGGQLPIMKALPMLRGFTNIFREEYAEVNLGRLNGFPAGTNVTPALLYEAGIVRKRQEKVKVLAGGILTMPLNVVAHRFSATARTAIEAAGGSVEKL
jgi:large subunit ribosomal protein L15